jgi:hypothetical protein
MFVVKQGGLQGLLGLLHRVRDPCGPPCMLVVKRCGFWGPVRVGAQG